jgi:homoserine dehydrogenase
LDEVIGIGLLGVGTVGSGVVKLLRANESEIAQRAGRRLCIKRILERDQERLRSLGLTELGANSFQDLLDDPEIQIIVELLGGIEPARTYLLEALRRGKHVVTANKDLVSAHGKDLFAAAAATRSDFYFEASVGGGIPVIRVLKECLAANRITAVIGIVNGTTNYILTRMSEEGLDFDAALAAARAAGYAEADPSADLEGLDAARKIAILASIAFNSRIVPDDVFVEGITRITQQDISYARELGYVIKLLAIAREQDEVEVRVHPALLPKSHPLAAVQGVFNAIFVEGNAVGETMFYGRGAGQMPTASAVVGDIMEIVHNIATNSTGRFSCTCFYEKKIRPRGQFRSRYYIRLVVKDQPGVLASIAGVFGDHRVSLGSVIQKRTLMVQGVSMAELVLITHDVLEQDVQDALAVISGLSVTGSVENVIRVEGGGIS